MIDIFLSFCRFPAIFVRQFAQDCGQSRRTLLRDATGGLISAQYRLPLVSAKAHTPLRSDGDILHGFSGRSFVCATVLDGPQHGLWCDRQPCAVRRGPSKALGLSHGHLFPGQVGEQPHPHPHPHPLSTALTDTNFLVFLVFALDCSGAYLAYTFLRHFPKEELKVFQQLKYITKIIIQKLFGCVLPTP